MEDAAASQAEEQNKNLQLLPTLRENEAVEVKLCTGKSTLTYMALASDTPFILKISWRSFGNRSQSGRGTKFFNLYSSAVAQTARISRFPSFRRSRSCVDLADSHIWCAFQLSSASPPKFATHPDETQPL